MLIVALNSQLPFPDFRRNTVSIGPGPVDPSRKPALQVSYIPSIVHHTENNDGMQWFIDAIEHVEVLDRHRTYPF